MLPPRIIFVNRVYAPTEAATAQLLTDLAEGLAARGWPVHVIAAGGGGGNFPPSEERAGVIVHRTGPHDIHAGALSRLANYLGFLRGARRRLAALSTPDDIIVLLTDPPLLAIAATPVAVRSGARVVQWIQDIYPEIVVAHTGPWLKLPLAPLKWARNRAWRSAQRCVTLSHGMGAAIDTQQLTTRPCEVIPNWAPRELEATPAPDAVAAQRETWGLPGKFIIAYSGNLGRVHEFDTVLAAAACLQSRSGIEFLFVGGGPRLPAMRREAKQRSLTNVRFVATQPRANLACSLAAADVQLVTLKPGFEHLVYPSKLAGVLAAGRPVLSIGPLSGEIAQLLAREGCGTSVANGDSARLVECIERLRANPSLCRQQSRNARAAYARHFGFARAMTAWEHLFTELAGKH